MQTTKAGVTALYAHNAFGERVCKGSSGPTCATSADRTEYVYDDDGHLIGEYGPAQAQTEVLWLEDTPIAVLKRRPGSSDGGPGGGGSATLWTGMAAGGVDVYFVHPDHLDTPRVVVNALNQPVWRWDSAPFGDTAANEQPTGGVPSFSFNLRFPGQQYDRETGTHYNYFRDYEAQTGRYVQSDPVGLEGGNNTFSYVEQNVPAFSDRYGLKKGPKPGGNGNHVPHPNNSFASTRLSCLYEIIGACGRRMKWGISVDPSRRYTRSQLSAMGGEGTYVKNTGICRQIKIISELERYLVERIPGPENKEPWAGKKSCCTSLADLNELLDGFAPGDNPGSGY